MDKNEITEELQLRTAQIMDLRQKIFDSNEGMQHLKLNTCTPMLE